jgi:hypothetical protein
MLAITLNQLHSFLIVSDMYQYLIPVGSAASDMKKTRSMQLPYSYIIRQVPIPVIERFYHEIQCHVKPKIPTIS